MRLTCLFALATSSAFAVDFVREVRPIFEKHCYECHGPEKQKNDYRLDIKAVALKHITPGKSSESTLFRFVSGLEKDTPMPPKSKLSAAELETIKRWIDDGANWPDGVDLAKLEDKTNWWAFKPLSKPQGEGVDNFIRAKLKEEGLTAAQRADSRTLIRRLFYDLTGLPPTPSDLSDWSDLSDERYEKLVDHLLSSPRYGERWARHWLDAVHYGETHGYDKDKPRLNAWPYRDYVIRALNNDKPYARFIEEQIAGDALYPGTVDGITALGFIAAGPWDYIGHAEVPETKLDGKIARHAPPRPFLVANILSMRSVMRNPLTMLMVEQVTATTPSTLLSSGASPAPVMRMAPTTEMAEIALVNDISGVCSSGDTRCTSSRPRNPARRKT